MAKNDSQDLKVGGAGIDSIRLMLDLARKASKFNSWYYFLKDISLKSARVNYANQLAKIEQIMKELQLEVNNFKSSII